MTFPTVFANLAAGTQPASLLDVMYNVVGGMGNIPANATGTNAITLTPAANFYQPASYLNNQMVTWLQPATTTSLVTVQLGALAFVNLYLANGQQASAGDLAIGDHCTAVFASDLNSSAGGFILVSNYPRSPPWVSSRITSDQSFTNNAVLATVLSAPLVAGRTYLFDVDFFVTMGSSAGGMQVSVVGTGGLTATNVVWSVVGGDSTGVNIGGAVNTALGATFIFTGTGTSALLKIDGTITVNVAGTLAIQAAQRVSNAAATIYKQGSSLLVANVP